MHGPRKHLRQTVIDFSIAACLAIAFTAIIGWGFRPKQGATNSRKKQELIIMLPLNKQECRKSHQTLISYIEIDNPAEIPMPHDYGPNGGYTSRTGYDRNNEYVPQKERYTPVKPAIEPETPFVFGMRDVDTPITDMEFLVRHEELRQPPLLPPPPPLPRAKPGIVWVDLDGKPLDSSFPRQSVESLGSADLVISGPTELRSTPPLPTTAGLSLLPCVQVSTSCGNPALDRAAVIHLSRYLASLSVRRTDDQWSRWFNTPRTVRVVWHHVPGVTYRELTEERPAKPLAVPAIPPTPATPTKPSDKALTIPGIQPKPPAQK